MRVNLPSGESVTAPTLAETLRIKAFLILRRNQTRDYLDVAALIDRIGIDAAAAILSLIDDYYADQHGGGDGVASQVARQLATPEPRDRSTTRDLRQYKNLAFRWRDWAEVVAVCRRVTAAMLDAEVPR
ncbi:MAG: hypothetical protein ACRDRK_22680 [Pseudonocardia sp.]